MSVGDVPDKVQLYKDYRDAEAAQRKLYLKAAHKALDIAEDDMQINSTKTTNGVGPLGLTGAIGAAAGLPTGLLVLFLLFGNRAPALPDNNVPVKPVAASPATPAVPAAQPKPAKPFMWDEVEQQLQPDGTWKATGKTTRRRMGVDGAVETMQPDGTWKKDSPTP